MQQINLYPTLPGKTRQVPSFDHLLWTIAVLVLAGLLLSAGLTYSLQRQRHQTEALQSRVAALQAELTALQKAQSRPADAKLQHRLELVRQQQERSTEIRRRLEQVAHTDQTGFIGPLEALGRQRVNGLWLDRIRLRADGGILLAGRSRSADLLPDYLQGLSAQPVFHGVEFHQLELKRPEDGGAYRFAVGTVGEKTDAK